MALLKNPLPKPLMLKDYLLDDLSSCSSSGFRSFPRTKCCTNILQFLLDINLIKNQKKPLLKTRSKSLSSTTVSAFQKATEAVLNVVKFIPNNSFSKKLSRRNFWKKTDGKEIRRWKSFRDLIGEQPKPSDFCTSATTTTGDESNSESWSDGEFTIISSCNSYEMSSGENVLVALESIQRDKMVREKVGVADVDDTMEAISTTTNSSSVGSTKNEWSNEEKEQFSPVSVLDCPFDDEDVSSPFQCRLARMEGSKQKVMQKIQRFEGLTQLEPVDLLNRFALSESDHELLGSHLQSTSLQNNIISCQEYEADEVQQTAIELLQLTKVTIPSMFKFQSDNLLLDFFREKILEGFRNNKMVTRSNITVEFALVDEAKTWINGLPCEMFGEWEVKKNRQMEKCEKWIGLDEEKQEVALELESQVLASLVNEVFADLLSISRYYNHHTASILTNEKASIGRKVCPKFKI